MPFGSTFSLCESELMPAMEVLTFGSNVRHRDESPLMPSLGALTFCSNSSQNVSGAPEELTLGSNFSQIVQEMMPTLDVLKLGS